MKVRFISDIHYYLNLETEPTKFSEIMSKMEPADYTLIAGDMSADINEAQEFLEKYFKYENVVFVNGNHALYHIPSEPIQEIIESYRNKFNRFDNQWRFLENDYIFIDNHIAVIGCTGWTNFEYGHQTKSQYIKEVNREKAYREKHKDTQDLFDSSKRVPIIYTDYLPEDPAKEYDELQMGNKESYRGRRMRDAARNMNDYNYGKIQRDDGMIDILRPLDTYNMHQESIKQIKRCYDEILYADPNAKIILMTHHPFTSKCVHPRFEGDLLTPAFVSNHDRWLKQFSKIKYVVCGHVHSRHFCNIAGDKQLICNSMGYLHYYEHIQDVPFDINKFIEV